MKEWKKVKLGDVVSIKSGLLYKSEFIGKGDNLLLGMGCVSYKENFLDSGVRPYSQDCDPKYMAAPGDLVLATRQQSDNLPILAMPAIIPKKYLGKKIIIGTNLYRVENNSDIDNSFLFFVLKSHDYVNYIRGVKTGTTVQMVSKHNVEEYRFLCPPKETREYIVNILSRYDSLIENFQKQIKLLEESAQRLYKEWFIDLRFPGHENVQIVDGVPEGWEKKNLGDITPIKTGKRDANFGTADGEYPFFTCAQEPIKSPAYSFDTSAVILAGNGDFNVKLYRGKFEAYQRTYVLEPNDTNMLYLLFFCVLENMNRLATGASGSTIKFLTKGMIESLDLYEPAVDTLCAFNMIVEPIQRQKESLSTQIRHLAEARDRLLPKLMSGEVIVKR